MNERILPFINPATGEQFGSLPMTTAAEIRQAVAQMRRSAPVWQQKTPAERARILKQLQAVLIEHADEIIRVVNVNTGKSRQDALAELFLVVDKLQTYRRHAPGWLQRQRVPPGIYVFKRYYVEPRPFGVVAVIGPWNLPLDLSIPPVYAALLAGNTVVLKPSEATAAVGQLIERLFQSVPELSPFVRVIHGDGAVGAELVASNPDLVFLTGSTDTGLKVAEATARRMIPFIHELGGKDPMIVLEDADVRKAAHWGVWGAFYHSGQTCVSIERVYVVADVYDAFVAAVMEEMAELRHGYTPEKENPYHLGPISFERQIGIIERHLEDARARGARVLTGGGRTGLFVEPTVLVDVDHSMALMREESFGPFMPIMKVRDEEEAIRLANDSEYGLSASVWSRDLERARRVAQRLDVGSVVVNDTIAHYAVSMLPFGGVKLSGSARTHGKQDVLQFTQSKAYGIGGAPIFLDIVAMLRQPNNYGLMNTLMHVLFGVNLQQRLRPLGEGVEEATKVVTRSPRRTAAAAGLAAGVAALALSLLRGDD